MEEISGLRKRKVTCEYVDMNMKIIEHTTSIGYNPYGNGVDSHTIVFEILNGAELTLHNVVKHVVVPWAEIVEDMRYKTRNLSKTERKQFMMQRENYIPMYVRAEMCCTNSIGVLKYYEDGVKLASIVQNKVSIEPIGSVQGDTKNNLFATYMNFRILLDNDVRKYAGMPGILVAQVRIGKILELI